MYGTIVHVELSVQYTLFTVLASTVHNPTPECATPDPDLHRVIKST